MLPFSVARNLVNEEEALVRKLTLSVHRIPDRIDYPLLIRYVEFLKRGRERYWYSRGCHAQDRRIYSVFVNATGSIYGNAYVAYHTLI